MSKHDVHTVEGAGFVAKVHYDDTTWHAKVRLEDEGVRGKNLVLNSDSAQGLSDQLFSLASAFTSTGNKVLELERTQSEVPPVS